jgi:hypothetical protein
MTVLKHFNIFSGRVNLSNHITITNKETEPAYNTL